jgi:hypothetical protein
MSAVLTCILGGFMLMSPLSAQTLSLSLDEGRVAARQAALSGQFQLARDFALALTDANPDDRAALVVLAAVQPQLGAPRDGRLAGARAYRLSDTDDTRYEAARLTALAAANEDRYTLSQLWLRRASVNAPDEEAFEQTQSDYRAIRNLNPWSINLGLSLTPSNNVNGGSETAFNVIDGLPFVGVLSGDAQALSGVAAAADLRLIYAISRQPDSRTSITARAYARAIWLSDDARLIAPTSTNSDFGSQTIEFGFEPSAKSGGQHIVRRSADRFVLVWRGSWRQLQPRLASIRQHVVRKLQRNVQWRSATNKPRWGFSADQSTSDSDDPAQLQN